MQIVIICTNISSGRVGDSISLIFEEVKITLLAKCKRYRNLTLTEITIKRMMQYYRRLHEEGNCVFLVDNKIVAIFSKHKYNNIHISKHRISISLTICSRLVYSRQCKKLRFLF